MRDPVAVGLGNAIVLEVNYGDLFSRHIHQLLSSCSLSLSDFGFNCLRFIPQFFNSQVIRPRVIAQFLAEYKKQYSTYAFLMSKNFN